MAVGRALATAILLRRRANPSTHTCSVRQVHQPSAFSVRQVHQPSSSSERQVHRLSPISPGFPVSRIFAALALFGLSITAYGLYDFYTSFVVWPDELRQDLRPAIKAQQQGDLALSERYLRRAWQTCHRIPRETLGAAEPWLKISGIACKLGQVLEDSHLPHKAYEVYAECLSMMQVSASRHELSPAERHRAVALAMHLGELADELGRSEDEEKFLSWSVEEFVRMSKTNSADALSSRHRSQPEVAELSLPEWTSKDDFEAALEALGSCYAKTGKIDYALNLYLQALSIMLPPNSATSTTPQRRCRAAQLMTNISGLLIHDAPAPDRLAQANMWTTKGLEVTEKARNELARSRTTDAECERVWVILLFNLGAVLEMQNNLQLAKEYFTRSLAHANGIGMVEGVREADDALARLSSLT